jgi:hypothetical protein
MGFPLSGIFCSERQRQLNYIHRFAGRVIIITANIHAISYRKSLLNDRSMMLILLDSLRMVFYWGNTIPTVRYPQKRVGLSCSLRH